MPARLSVAESSTAGIAPGYTFPASRYTRSASPAGPKVQGPRGRSVSNASTASSLSIVSPASTSTNGSTTSLLIPTPSVSTAATSSRPSSRAASRASTRSRSISPSMEETVRLGPEYVLAMHDYAPEHGHATCLSFRAGQVIHVLNRDSSGWWDGELEGRRGWFPSNYVSAEVTNIKDEDLMEAHNGHRHTGSQASIASWEASSSSSHGKSSRNGHNRAPSAAHSDLMSNEESESYCPPLMVPLLHGLTLLQNAVRGNRTTHFQPSTACIISCVRSILSATDTLQRDAPVLQLHPPLAEERRRILTVLASLVAQAKKASDDTQLPTKQTEETAAMVRLAGQVFAHVRRFLSVAADCGVELPDEPDTSMTQWAAASQSDHGGVETPQSTAGRTPTQHRLSSKQPAPAPGPQRTKSQTDLRSRMRSPLLAQNGSLTATATMDNKMRMDQNNSAFARGHRPTDSTSSLSSISSFSSNGSVASASPPPFPNGPSTIAQVLEALRYTHDQYLSTIAAFIGHAHSHSKMSHASSTGQLYDLVREIVELVCRLLTIVEAVMQHPDVPVHRIGQLKSAKDGLFKVTSSLAESVRMLTTSSPSMLSEEDEKKALLTSATSALKAGADCVAAVKVCLTRSIGDRPFIVKMPNSAEQFNQPFTPNHPKSATLGPGRSSLYHLNGMDDEDLTIQAVTPSPIARQRRPSVSSGSESGHLGPSLQRKTEPRPQPEPPIRKPLPPPNGIAPIRMLPKTPIEPELPSPKSFVRSDDGTTWEGSLQDHGPSPPSVVVHLEPGAGRLNNDLPSLPDRRTPDLPPVDPMTWMFSHEYPIEDVAYNNDGHLVGATMGALVEKMTPHDSLVDPAFSAVFFLTFRLFSSPVALVDALIARYNLTPPPNITLEDEALWQQQKGIPVRLRVSNFVKTWVETYWRPGVDDPALTPLTLFTREGLGTLFPGPAQRIMELLNVRRHSSDVTIGLKGDRSRDPGMLINPPIMSPTEIPRPTMTKTLLASLRKRDFGSIAVTDFDALELARQLTIMECELYCAIQPSEVLETGQEGAARPLNVRAVTSLSTVITGWVAESILDEMDLKKRTLLVKFFVKLADRCVTLHNFSTSRSILAALDSSTISRLRQTWAGLPQKYKLQMETLRKLADHSRNYHEYRARLRNTPPPAVPFLGLYLTDVTFCREGNPSHRPSPKNPNKKLINFNKYHKLARIVQDMQRFQVPYNLKAIPEVQQYLNVAFERAKHHGDLQDLYRRSLMVEPKQAADSAPTSDMRQLFNWATRSAQPQATSS